ncbi:MAG: HDOD domain-containing protein [Gammaproteobacteria bacterium]|nr:HDOD domain-containing protein [Gammaproteobacteria bacterium]
MTPRELVQGNVQLLSLPEVCLRIQQLADDPYADISEFAQLVAQDPALTTRLLKLVNSAYFGFPGRVDTISRAVNLVGIAELRNITLAMAAVEVFGGFEHEHFDLLGYWRHSVYTALTARFLARHARVLHAERLFTAGLLHDIGRLLIFNLLPESAARIRRRMDQGMDACAAEREELGFDHAEAGSELLELWRLPRELRITVALHHAPETAPAARLETAAVHIANQIARQVEATAPDNRTPRSDPFSTWTDPLALDAAETLPHIDAIAAATWSQAGLAPEIVPEAVAAAARDFDEVLNILYSVP